MRKEVIACLNMKWWHVFKGMIKTQLLSFLFLKKINKKVPEAIMFFFCPFYWYFKKIEICIFLHKNGQFF
jgi:hypothetical protein